MTEIRKGGQKVCIVFHGFIHLETLQRWNWRSFYLVALLIRAKKSLNERDNSVMEFIVPAWPHKPWWCRLLGLNHVRTLQLNEDYPWVEPCAYSAAAERGLFRKIDAIVSFFMDLFTWKQPIAPPPCGPARSTGACRRWPREWVFCPRVAFRTRARQAPPCASPYRSL